MSEKYYIVHYPSSRGMGSHINISLVSESNLYRIIEMEVDKMKNSISEGGTSTTHYDERFVGAWKDEVFCNSSDIKEVIADVMQKRLTTCSTYANVNDWILLPDEIPMEISEEKMSETVFMIYDHWFWERDVIAGEALFKKYRIDLTKYEGQLGLENGLFHEFVGYDLKNVLGIGRVSQFAQNEVLWAKQQIAQNRSDMEKYKDLVPHNKFEERKKKNAEPEYCERIICELEKQIDKLRELPVIKDEYTSYIYKPEGTCEEHLETIKADLKAQSETDHTQLVYRRMIGKDKFACQISDRFPEEKVFTYSELFQKGIDVSYLMADWARDANDVNEFNKMDVSKVLYNVFYRT